MIVVTLATSIALNVSRPTRLLGSTDIHTNAHRDAKKSSTIIPAAPTKIRCHLFGNDQALEASTYGVGMNTRNMIPSSWHSPPKRLHEKACPSSWIALTKTNTPHRRTMLTGSERMLT